MRLLWFRLFGGILAAVILASAIWIVAAELISPRRPYFPANPNEAQLWSAARAASRTAASIGLLRGDLWTAAAINEAVPMLFAAPEPSSVSTAEVESARIMTERAARLAPHDPRNWLALASLQSRWPKSGPEAGEALKLSYYTGPNEFALTPLRLSVAAGMHWDEDLQSLVQLEIERVIMDRPTLKSAISAAYAAAMPEERRFIEATLKQTDPEFLRRLTTGARP